MKHMHTPGPWNVVVHSNGIEDTPAITAEQFGTIAETRRDVYSFDECLANATLIAAAPDLLAALEYWFDSKATPGEIARRARAAIAKARRED